MKNGNKRLILHGFLMLVVITKAMDCCAQQAARDNIEGTWKGTSLCQVKPSPCHDENAVYHISKTSNGKNYTIQMNKIVNGAEEEMGASVAVYDETKHTLTSITEGRQGRPVFGFSRLMETKCMEHSRLKGKLYTGSLR